MKIIIYITDWVVQTSIKFKYQLTLIYQLISYTFQVNVMFVYIVSKFKILPISTKQTTTYHLKSLKIKKKNHDNW
jgi:hypothetical protein